MFDKEKKMGKKIYKLCKCFIIIIGLSLLYTSCNFLSRNEDYGTKVKIENDTSFPMNVTAKKTVSSNTEEKEPFCIDSHSVEDILFSDNREGNIYLSIALNEKKYRCQDIYDTGALYEISFFIEDGKLECKCTGRPKLLSIYNNSSIPLTNIE